MKWICLFFLYTPAFAIETDAFVFQTKSGKVELKAQVADTSALRQKGLMWVKELPRDEGMLFVFENEQTLSFWMKNTLIPLSIGFLDHQGVLVDVQEMTTSLTTLSPPLYSSIKEATFALEMTEGWFKKHHVVAGDKLLLLSKSDSKLLQSYHLGQTSVPKAASH